MQLQRKRTGSLARPESRGTCWVPSPLVSFSPAHECVHTHVSEPFLRRRTYDFLCLRPNRGTPFSSPRPVALRSAADTVDTKRLRLLMAGLAQDMAPINTGIWHEHFGLVEQGAASIANHPRISPDPIAKIKQTLDEEFQNFVRFDKAVHGTATELVSARSPGLVWRAQSIYPTSRRLLRMSQGLPPVSAPGAGASKVRMMKWKQRPSSPQSSGAPAPVLGG